MSTAKPELQKFCKQIGYFESVETDIYNLRMLVMSFIDKIRTVLEKNNPVEVVEEFDKWFNFFILENKRLLDYIKNRTCEEVLILKSNQKKREKSLEWYSEINKINTRQILTNIFESEAHSMSKIDHPMYFRRRFLKSKLISEEVNELRMDESSQKNQDYIQKLFPNCIDLHGRLYYEKVISILMKIPENQFQYKFSSDPLNGPILIMFAKKKIVFTIRVDTNYIVPK